LSTDCGWQEKLQRQQRDVETLAYQHRQRILKEEARLKESKQALAQQVSSLLG